MEPLNQIDKNRVVAVSKLQPVELIRSVYAKGFRHFGENYVQEALKKIQSTEDLKIKWHFIGTLQRNKIKHIIGKFEYIHSIESVGQIRLLNERSEAADLCQKIFLQVNIANEATKSGFSAQLLQSEFKAIQNFKNTEVVGLMTMPPLSNLPEENRPHFKALRNLAAQFGLKELSMGTSHDYKIALEEGATWVRLGTVLFGERTRS